MKKFKKESGITLIALIITIIILVILAAVSIRAVTNMKIVDYAVNGSQNYVVAGKNENKVLENTGDLLEDTLDKLDEIQGQKNGIYIGDVRINSILPVTSDQEELNTIEIELSRFFQKCYQKEAKKEDLNKILEMTNKYDIPKEYFKYAFNNQGDRLRNFRVSQISWEMTGYDKCDLKIPCAIDLTGFDDKYMNINMSIDIHTTCKIINNEIQYENVTMNPESISICWYHAPEEKPESVDLPFGMKMNLIKDSDADDNFEIIWQGHSYRGDEGVGELREYILNNLSIRYNDYVYRYRIPGKQYEDTKGESIEELCNKMGLTAEKIRGQ